MKNLSPEQERLLHLLRSEGCAHKSPTFAADLCALLREGLIGRSGFLRYELTEAGHAAYFKNRIKNGLEDQQLRRRIDELLVSNTELHNTKISLKNHVLELEELVFSMGANMRDMLKLLGTKTGENE